MSRRARHVLAAGIVSAVVVACATPYGSDEPPATDAGASDFDSAAAMDALSSSDAATATIDANATKDAAAGDADAGPLCVKKADGLPCLDKSECCSSCNQASVCHSCASNLGSCNPLDTAPCCKGFYCATGFCTVCIAAGGTPTTGTGGGVKSCCSQQIDANTGKCK